ncbi:GNAT family N-acetyltransferase [Puniceibacterium sp. IMCC21224]|uniref:GNAT family N-acetyltransferase n=1 Tax=Puniceibacterium sp. IMCC21224 TaxID=1618204 RepID=UPI00064DC9DB|nr:GNAT family N-acetyltransferase [Puniceibacterium sp. IMCC21224]KMK66982.1 Acetyltransferase (GNAT) domain [Puniceibacterium sp. IMCC21224]
MRFPDRPLPQSTEFAETCAHLGIALQRHETHEAVWQSRQRRVPILGAVDIVSRGPVWHCAAAPKAWLNQVKRPLILNADGIDATALRAAGFWPLVTPATLALLPLGTPVAMRGALRQKWRNRLNRAESAGLHVTHNPLRDANHWLLQAEAAQASAKGYRGWPAVFSAAYAVANPGAAQLFEAWRGSQRLAGLLILRHGSMATYHIGHSAEDGRKTNAMNLLLWQAMLWLSGQGVTRLDLGMINTQDAPGLARFKLGTGAARHRLGGTWIWHPCLTPVARRLPRFMAT